MLWNDLPNRLLDFKSATANFLDSFRSELASSEADNYGNVLKYHENDHDKDVPVSRPLQNQYAEDLRKKLLNFDGIIHEDDFNRVRCPVSFGNCD